MDPNQQPNPTPTPPSNPYGQPPIPQAPSAPTPAPQAPSAYAATPQPTYDPNYLDSIAPPPPPPKFFSGSFGKIFFVLIALFVVAVSVIIAFSGKDETADLQQVAVRLDNFSRTTKTVQKNLKSSNLATINSNFMIWITGSQSAAEDLLKQGGIKKTQYSKTMVADEKKIDDDLDAKFEDARLNATLNRVYGNTMSSETEKLINLLNTMAKKNKSAKIRDFAKTASTNLTPIQKSFNDYNDDGN